MVSWIPINLLVYFLAYSADKLHPVPSPLRIQIYVIPSWQNDGREKHSGWQCKVTLENSFYFGGFLIGAATDESHSYHICSYGVRKTTVQILQCNCNYTHKKLDLRTSINPLRTEKPNVCCGQLRQSEWHNSKGLARCVRQKREWPAAAGSWQPQVLQAGLS